jgi:hypothetical protein
MTRARDAGLTLVEVLVAMAMALVATGGVLLIASWQVTLAVAAPEAVELRQRARAALAAIVRDLSMAGAGPTGGVRDGPLGRYFAPILPRALHADSFAAARSDAISVLFVPVVRAQASLAAPLAPAETTAVIAALPNCPQGLPACGLEEGSSLLLFSADGRFDIAAVSDVPGDTVTLRRRPGEEGPSFEPGASAVAAEAHVYYFDAARRQLRHHDVDRTDTPVAGDVVQMAIEYFGDVEPPGELRPPVTASNCLYEIGGAQRPELTLLGPPPFTLFPLPRSRFEDGPWCGEGGTRFDADLLRVRLVRIRLRMRATPAAVRGQIGHTMPGTSHRPAATVPDLEITFDVAPRNLGVIR